MVSLIVVIAAAIGIYAYYSWSTAQAKGMALDMSMHYPGLVDRNATFKANWEKFDKQHRCNRSDSIYERCLRYFIGDPRAKRDFTALRQFFDAVGTCTESRMCDFDTASDLFGDDVSSFYENMYPMLDESDALVKFARKIEDRGSEATTQTNEPGSSGSPVYTTPDQSGGRRNEREPPSLYQRVSRWWGGSAERRRD
jgi:hypothetical protein